MKIPTQKQERADGELLQDFVRRGSHEAFECLMKRHANMVYGVCRRILNNHHEAEDVTQAVFVHLARHSKKLRRGGSVAGWLHTVARRLSLNALRSGSRRKAREMNSALGEEPSSMDDRRELKQDLRRELDEAIAELPERYRVPLVLFHLEQCSLAQVAEQLSTKPSTIGTRLSRARDMLRASLATRGVAIGSVSGLVVMLSAEAKAAVLPAVSSAVSLEAVLGEAFSAKSAAVEGTMIAMKSGALVRAVTVLAALGVMGLLVLGYRSINGPSSGDDGHDSETDLARLSPRNARNDDPNHRGTGRISANRGGLEFCGHAPFTAPWHVEVEKAFAMQPGPEQLAVIRTVLGMSISDRVYDVILHPAGYKKRSYEEKLGLVLKKWVEEDPRAMMQWAKTAEEKKFTMRILAGWIATDAESARAYAQEHFSEEMLTEAEQRAVRFLPPDLEKIRANIHQYEELAKNDPNSRELSNLIRDWSLVEPAEAAAYLLTLPSTYRDGKGAEHDLDWYRFSMSYVVENWADKDPDAALEWASANLSEDELHKAYETIIPCLARKYPGDEIDISGLPENTRNRITFQLVEILAESDPVAALNYSLNLQDDSMRASCASEVASDWHLRDPDAAMTWMLTEADRELRDESLSKIAKMNCQGNISISLEMLAHMQAGELKDQTASHVVTFGLEHHKMAEVLKVMDQMDQVNFTQIGNYADDLEGRSTQEIEAFRSWVAKANANGKIHQALFRQEQGETPEAAAERERKEAAKAYESVMNTLDAAAQTTDKR